MDPNPAEEKCSVGSIVVAVSGDKFTTILQSGASSLHPATLLESLKLGHVVAQRLDKSLLEALDLIPQNQDVGFLK